MQALREIVRAIADGVRSGVDSFAGLLTQLARTGKGKLFPNL